MYFVDRWHLFTSVTVSTNAGLADHHCTVSTNAGLADHHWHARAFSVP